MRSSPRPFLLAELSKSRFAAGGFRLVCVGSPYEANPGGSPDVENTAQSGFAANHPFLR